MDRWAGSDSENDRWAQNDRHYDWWAEDERQHGRRSESDRPYDRWAGADREYDHLPETNSEHDPHDRSRRYARSPKVKWTGLLIAWVIVTGVLLVVHLTILIWVIMVGLIGYVVYGVLRDTPRVARPPRRHTTAAPVAEKTDDDSERFNPPPGWPEPPPGWTPPPGWQPNPAWPPPPPGWQFWHRPARRGYNERTGYARRRREPDDHRFTDGRR